MGIYCGSCDREVEPFHEHRATDGSNVGGGLYCPDCGRWLRWKSKEKNVLKNEKRPPYPSPKELGIDFCQICLRPKTWLGSAETLETHHVDGNSQNRNGLNYLVTCSMCHRLINFTRTYVNEHLKDKYEQKDKFEIYEQMKGRLRQKCPDPGEYDRQIILIAELLEI